jgi:hypothetical protein
MQKMKAGRTADKLKLVPDKPHPPERRLCCATGGHA